MWMSLVELASEAGMTPASRLFLASHDCRAWQRPISGGTSPEKRLREEAERGRDGPDDVVDAEAAEAGVVGEAAAEAALGERDGDDAAVDALDAGPVTGACADAGVVQEQMKP
jgi:hypothetical protein